MNFLLCPGNGTASNANTPDSSPLGITGDIDVRILLSMSAWSAEPELIGWRDAGSAANTGYSLRMGSGGAPEFYWANGSTFVSAGGSTLATVATGFAAWSTHWLRATRVQSTGAVAFYTSNDGTNWTQLGTTLTGGGTAAANNSTLALRIGAMNSTGADMYGRVYYAEVRNGVNGTVVASPDFRNAAELAATITDAQGNVWTPSSGAVILGGGAGSTSLSTGKVFSRGSQSVSTGVISG